MENARYFQEILTHLICAANGRDSEPDSMPVSLQEKLLRLPDDLCTPAELEDQVDGFKTILGNDFRVEHIS